MRNIILDIETGPADEATVLQFLPEIERGKVPANYKDPAKIAEAEQRIEADYQAQKARAIERAALSAETGIILAVGYCDFPGKVEYILNDKGNLQGEIDLLGKFTAKTIEWRMAMMRDSDTRIIGHNLKGFDLPFIARRAMRHRMYTSVLREAFYGPKPTRYFAPWIIDTMEVWAMGERERRISLNNAAKFFGFPEKLGTGDQFAGWFLGGERQKALDYLAQDLMLAANVAKAMGAIDASEIADNEDAI